MKMNIRHGLSVSVLAVGAVALSACGAGQVSQTADQVAAVDGASVNAENNVIALRDVTVHMTADGSTAGIKFTAVNQDSTNVAHTLESVAIGNNEANFDGDTTIEPQGSLVSDLPEELERIAQADDMNINYVANTIDNDDYAFGGTQTVIFTFDDAVIEVQATVSEPQPESGTLDRSSDNGESAH